MNDQTQASGLEWTEAGVPVSLRFDDPYYSLVGGLAETRHVFLDGNDLPARFKDGFHVAELGFGTGLNLLATWALWRATRQQGQLRFTSFEAFPLEPSDMRSALQAFPEVAGLADEMLAALTPQGFEGADVHFTLITGDARDSLPNWNDKADAWFLDGFSPAKNPELWGADLMQAVADHTQPNGTLATYTAAGHVRRALDSAGFEISRVAGFGRKRHMTRGVLRE